jgi:hypothetical protein
MLLNMAPEAVRKVRTTVPSWPVQTCHVFSVHGAFPAQVETPIAGGGLLSALAANMPTIGQDR